MTQLASRGKQAGVSGHCYVGANTSSTLRMLPPREKGGKRGKTKVFCSCCLTSALSTQICSSTGNADVLCSTPKSTTEILGHGSTELTLHYVPLPSPNLSSSCHHKLDSSSPSSPQAGANPIKLAIRSFRLVCNPGGGLGSAPGSDCCPLSAGRPLYAHGPHPCTGLRRPPNPVPLVCPGCAHVGSRCRAACDCLPLQMDCTTFWLSVD